MRATLPQGTHGFSLLEALVALVIIAGVGSAVYSWIHTNLIAVERSRHAINRSEAVAAALTVIDDINPMQARRGRTNYGGYQISWTSTPVEQPRQGVNRTGGAGLYRVGLYRLEIRIARDESAAVDIVVRQAGYRQIGVRGDQSGAL